MSDRELGRFEVLRDLDQRRLTTAAAAQLLGLERRQVYRLSKTYRAEGAAGLISKRRGCPSNRRKPEKLRTEALAIIRERYWDFGPTRRLSIRYRGVELAYRTFDKLRGRSRRRRLSRTSGWARCWR